MRYTAMPILLALLLMGCTGTRGPITHEDVGSGPRTRMLGMEWVTENGPLAVRRDDSGLWHIVTMESGRFTVRFHRPIGAVPVRVCATHDVDKIYKLYDKPYGKPCFKAKRAMSLKWEWQGANAFPLRVTNGKAHNFHPKEHRVTEDGVPSLTYFAVTDRKVKEGLTRGRVHMAVWADLDADQEMDQDEIDLVLLLVQDEDVLASADTDSGGEGSLPTGK